MQLRGATGRCMGHPARGVPRAIARSAITPTPPPPHATPPSPPTPPPPPHCAPPLPLPSRRGDLDLWSRWLRFCQRSRSHKQMSKVLTKALQLHSGCAPLWTYAAAWEFEHNLNAAAARALMQRGLRMCKHAPQVGWTGQGGRGMCGGSGRWPALPCAASPSPSAPPPTPPSPPQLWHEYFRLELLYALRLRERRRVLGIGGGDDDLAGEGEGGDEAAAAVAAVLNGAVARVVYVNAIAAFPDSVPFRSKFLDMLAPLNFPGKAALEVGGRGWAGAGRIIIMCMHRPRGRLVLPTLIGPP